MGLESFQIILSGGPASLAEVNAGLRALPDVRPGPESGFVPAWPCFVFDDGRHVIELELSGPPPRISVRFALCQPASADAAFLDFIRGRMAAHGMEARVMDEVRPEHAGGFPLGRFAELAEAAVGYIAGARAAWVAMFGPVQAKATTAQAWGLVLPPAPRGSNGRALPA
jgi:hypothetical protein